MSIYHLNYYGQTKMDRRFSRPMLPWVISELQQRNHIEKVMMTFEEEELIVSRSQGSSTDESHTPLFRHQLAMVARATACLLDKSGFAYLYRESQDAQLLQLHFFQADDPYIVTELISATSLSNNKAPPMRSLSTAALTGIDADISPCSSQYFEVLYIGKIKVSHKKVPDSFIDDALEKFHRHELEKARESNKSLSLDSEKISSNKIACDVLEQGDSSQHPDVSTFVNSFNSDPSLQDKTIHKQRSLPLENTIQIPLKTTQTSNGDTNRTMVFQVGRSELRLISPDRKQILLHKSLKDVASCIQGLKNTDHLGFICRESALECYISYVFRCESEAVADELVSAITQAFIAAADSFRKDRNPQPLSCEHCPMVWYHKLCIELEGLGDRRSLGFILNKINSIPEDDYSYLSVKLRNSENYSSVKDQLCYLMTVLRVYCQTKQSRHVHDTAENRHEFLNQYLGGTTLFTKAKKSLASSFDQLLKRKGSKDDIGHGLTRELSLPLTTNKDDASPDSPDVRSSFDEESSPKTSPMLSIFLKVGSTQKHSPSREFHDNENEPRRQHGSWRQAIFNRVVSPNKSPNVTLLESCSPSITPERPVKLEPAHLRDLWKKAINQQLLLIRMEKENARLKARQEEASLKRIKLNYDELTTPSKEVIDVWDLLISKESKIQTECDSQMLLQAILRGVPKSKRGEVWQFLSDQHCLRSSFNVDTVKFPNYNTSYENLLKKLTSHQHSILIDLGRTFPENPYFATPLGPGQLALFNLLKAYSLLDPELGYCQGLSFIAGVLLLHVTETEAFNLLKHLMFVRDLRRRFLPDMQGLQVVLYQLNRLVHDQLPLLDKLLDSVEVPPTLYAAPWALTLFASQFPLGFVVRVFDLVFIEGPDVFFKIALALLFEHNEQMQKCESFETIMGYMKEQLTIINSVSLDGILKNAFSINITKQLREYEVEYHVLQEEMPKADDIEKYKKLEAENKHLHIENQNLQQLLEDQKISFRREQINANRLASQVRGMEVSVKTLGNFVLLILEKHPEIDVPDDVRRIADQLRSSNTKSIPLRVLGDHRAPLKSTLSSPNLSTRFSGINLFNKNIHKKEEILLSLNEDEKEGNDLLNSSVIKPKPTIPPKLISSKSAFELGTSKSNDPLIQKQEVLHPLDSCSVSIKYSGTRELPSLRHKKDDTKN